MIKVDIIMISETKVDDSFPHSQFEIAGYSSPFRLHINSYGGGIMLFFPDYLSCRKLKTLNNSSWDVTIPERKTYLTS